MCRRYSDILGIIPLMSRTYGTLFYLITCHTPANELAGYPYPVPTGLLHVPKAPYPARQRPCTRRSRLTQRRSRLPRAEGALSGRDSALTRGSAAFTRPFSEKFRQNYLRVKHHSRA